MSKKTILTVPCPMCKTPVARNDAFFPFCSQRCQTVDLGNWASDAYAIQGEPAIDIDAAHEPNPSDHD